MQSTREMCSKHPFSSASEIKRLILFCRSYTLGRCKEEKEREKEKERERGGGKRERNQRRKEEGKKKMRRNPREQRTFLFRFPLFLSVTGYGRKWFGKKEKSRTVV